MFCINQLGSGIEDSIQTTESVNRKHTNTIDGEGDTWQDADQPRTMFRKKKAMVATSNRGEKATAPAPANVVRYYEHDIQTLKRDCKTTVIVQANINIMHSFFLL